MFLIRYNLRKFKFNSKFVWFLEEKPNVVKSQLFYPNSKICDTGSKSHPKSSPCTKSQGAQVNKKRIQSNGEKEVGHWQQSRHHGSTWALGRVRFYDGANNGIHEAYVLGTLLGCDGTHMLLFDLNVLHGRLHLLPKDLKRTFLWRLLPSPFQLQAEATHEASQFWHWKV